MTSLRLKILVLSLFTTLSLAAARASTEDSVAPYPVTTTVPANPTVDTPSKPEDRMVTYDAGFSRWLSAPRTVEMSQGVSFQQGQAFLKTDAAVVHLDSKMNAVNAQSLSRVHLYDSSNDLTGNTGEVDFVHHIASLHGKVVLVTQRKAPGETDSEPATLTCDNLDYDYKKKIGTIPGALVVHQKDRILYADKGVYDTASQTITLTGNVHGHDVQGNNLQGPNATVIVTPGQESVTLQGPIHGSFPVPDEDDTGSAPAKKKPAHGDEKPGAGEEKPATEQRSSP